MRLSTVQSLPLQAVLLARGKGKKLSKGNYKNKGVLWRGEEIPPPPPRRLGHE